MEAEAGQVAVSRRIAASASDIFQVLVDPRKHLDLDGSGMVRGSVSDAAVSAVGDVFVIKMYYVDHGDYEMNNHVVEFEQDRRIGWEPEAGRGHPDAGAPAVERRWGQRWIYDLVPDGPQATIVTEIYDCSGVADGDRLSMDNGRIWIDAMTKTLERLDHLCTGRSAGQGR
jgi:hypothetical protein